MALYLLYESASGYALFERIEADEISMELPAVQRGINDLAQFSKMCRLKAFVPFESAESALENIMAISEGEATEFLVDFLERSLPAVEKSKEKKKKKKKDKKNKDGGAGWSLGVSDSRIGNVLSDVHGMACESNDMVNELLRGCRLHLPHFVKALREADVDQAQLGLGHSYSRSKVKFNVNKADNMIIQSIAILDQLDKALNTFAMRVREWYSWHFPELVHIVSDNYQFCALALLIRRKDELTEEKLPQIEEIIKDEDKAKAVLDAARMSMGTEISEVDMLNIENFARRVISMANYRKNLHEYLSRKMATCAPNLTSIVGEQVGARLISHAGSLTSLAKYPASTVQILGAEKALFRALKTKGNTPKYGLIYHSSFIGRAQPKNKGRISRYVANKCSIASRIDAFSEDPSDLWGRKMREQIEERLEFYKTGKAPRKNIDVMREAQEQINAEGEGGVKSMDADSDSDSDSDSDDDDDDKAAAAAKKKAEEEAAAKKKAAKKAKKSKKRKSMGGGGGDGGESDDVEMEVDEEEGKKSKKSKKKKKDKKKDKGEPSSPEPPAKKRRTESSAPSTPAPPAPAAATASDSAKKKKKKDKKEKKSKKSKK